MARYRRVVDFDFSAGDNYWKLTGEYWRDVRDVWAGIIDANQSFTLKASVDGVPLFMPFFSRAESIFRGEGYDSEEGAKSIRQTLDDYLVFE